MTGQVARLHLRPAVIVIPVKDEEERIGSCLQALRVSIANAQGHASVLCVHLLVNNTSDATVLRALEVAPSLPCPLIINEVELRRGDAHAGYARRLAAEHGVAVLESRAEDGLLLITDADSNVSPLWLMAHMQALHDGVEVIAGRVTIDESDLMQWPADLRRRQQLESALSDALVRLGSRIDPNPDDPEPHGDASGASLGALVSAYRRAGGVPSIPVG